jgi:uncharacterized protein YjbI with pentapeptide repeats
MRPMFARRLRPHSLKRLNNESRKSPEQQPSVVIGVVRDVGSFATFAVAAVTAFLAYTQGQTAKEQNILAESARRAGEISEMVSIFDALRQEVQTYCLTQQRSEFCKANAFKTTSGDLNPTNWVNVAPQERFRSSAFLYARINALAGTLRPYRYFEFQETNSTDRELRAINCGRALVDNKRIVDMLSAEDEIQRAHQTIDQVEMPHNRLVSQVYSPERSQLLRLLVTSGIDLGPLSKLNTSFSSVILDKAQLDGMQMPAAELSDSRFIEARLNSAKLPLARLNNSDFHCASMLFADLRGIYADKSSFAGVDLASADLRNAYITNSDFRVKRLAGADLRGATLFGSCLGDPENYLGATIDRQTFNGALVTYSGWLDDFAKYTDKARGFVRSEWEMDEISTKQCGGRPAYKIKWPMDFDPIAYMKELEQQTKEKKSKPRLKSLR